MLEKLKKDIQKLANPKKAKEAQRFFKTGPGQYGEGDKFLGLVMPEQRKLAKQYKNLSLEEGEKLLKSPFHEERMTALVILTNQFKKADQASKKKIFDIFVRNTKYINNWDLVDVNCPHVIGGFLFDKEKDILYKFARSNDLWKKRIAIVSTLYFISKNYFEDTLKLAHILRDDSHDLIHKAVGWMLREVGKRDVKKLEQFLERHAPVMPRTMLRYAIEKFLPEKRKYYLNKKNLI